MSKEENNLIREDKSFVVYAGDDRYPISEGVDAIGLQEIVQLLANSR